MLRLSFKVIKGVDTLDYFSNRFWPVFVFSLVTLLIDIRGNSETSFNQYRTGTVKTIHLQSACAIGWKIFWFSADISRYGQQSARKKRKKTKTDRKRNENESSMSTPVHPENRGRDFWQFLGKWQFYALWQFGNFLLFF